MVLCNGKLTLIPKKCITIHGKLTSVPKTYITVYTEKWPSARYSMVSDWPDLNEKCDRAGLELKWTWPATRPLIITDPQTSMEVMVNLNVTPHGLPLWNSEMIILNLNQQQWSGLWLQGKLARLTSADHCLLHSTLSVSALLCVFLFASKIQPFTLPSIKLQGPMLTLFPRNTRS